MTDLSKQEWVFILVLGGRLPKHYTSMAQEFADRGVTLVPVQFDQAVHFFKGRDKVHLLCVTGELNERRSMDMYLKARLAFALKNKLITIHHVSSFGAVDFGGLIRPSTYFHYALPVNLSAVVDQIVVKYRDLRDNDEKWPGGRRAKVPTTV